MKKKTKGKKGFMDLKLDMAKAYDRLEWIFVVGILESMGFLENFLKLIYTFISRVSFQILLNGCSSNSFISERGLHQRDPLSPCLLDMCADVFSGLIKEATSK